MTIHAPHTVPHPFNPQTWTHRQLNDEFAKALSDHLRDTSRRNGSRFFLITLTYKEPRNRPLTSRIAEARLKEFYRTALIPHLVHRRAYHKPQYRHLHPIMFAFPDVPNSKPKSATLTLNPNRARSPNTFHHHIIVAAYPDTAVKLDRLCGKDTLRLPPHLNISKPTLIKTSHCEAIIPADLEYTASYATSYALSQQSRSEGWMITLPENPSLKIPPIPAPQISGTGLASGEQSPDGIDWEKLKRFIHRKRPKLEFLRRFDNRGSATHLPRFSSLALSPERLEALHQLNV